MKHITVRQAEILIFIENFIEQHRYSPTVREIGDHFKVTAKGAQDHIVALIRKGALVRECKKPRTLAVTKKGEER